MLGPGRIDWYWTRKVKVSDHSVVEFKSLIVQRMEVQESSRKEHERREGLPGRFGP